MTATSEAQRLFFYPFPFTQKDRGERRSAERRWVGRDEEEAVEREREGKPWRDKAGSGGKQEDGMEGGGVIIYQVFECA